MRSPLVTEYSGVMRQAKPPTTVRHLDLLLGDYVAQHKSSHAPDVLHVTDISDCPRKVLLRLAGATVELDPLYVAKRDYMFHCGDVHHDEIYEALALEGTLVGCELKLHELELLPPGWHGSTDALAYRPKLGIFDVKSNHPNFIRYNQRVQEGHAKPGDAMQVRTYELFAGRAFGTAQDPQIMHKDRGGQNESIEVVVAMPANWLTLRDKLPLPDLQGTLELATKWGWRHLRRILERMLMLESWRDGYRIPDPLPLTFEYKEGWTYGTFWAEILQRRDWRCDYCDYADTAHCTPAEKPNKSNHKGVFKLEEGRWRVVRGCSASQQQEAIAWAAAQDPDDLQVSPEALPNYGADTKSQVRRKSLQNTLD